jgi:SAM-dependent methyltransferase
MSMARHHVSLAGRIARKVKSAWTDLRHGGYTGGVHASPYGHLGATHTVSTKHSLIPYLLGPILQDGDVFVDVGCGRGRVINWVLDDGRASAIYGMEIDKRFAAEVTKRHQRNDKVTVVAGNALEALPDSATLLYLWNPFDGSVMARFKERVIGKYDRLGTLERLRIVYHHARFIELWREDERCRIARIDLPAEEKTEAYLITFGKHASP